MVSKISTPIFAYSDGTAAVSEITAALQSAWSNIIVDKKKLAAAAAALELPEEELRDTALAPIEVVTGRSGLGGVDLAVVVMGYIGTSILLPALRSLAEEEVKRRLKALWIDVLEPAIMSKLRARDALGDRRDIT